MSRVRRLVRALRPLIDEIDRPIAWRLATAMSAVIGAGALGAVAPLMLKDMIDVAADPMSSSHGGSSSIATAAMGYLMAVSAVRVLQEVRTVLIATSGHRLQSRLTSRYFGQLLSLPMAWHDARHSAAVLQTVRQGLTGHQVLLSSAINGMAPVMAEVAAILVVLAQLGQPSLAATLALSAFAYHVVVRAGTSRLRHRATAVSEAATRLQSAMSDRLTNLEAIKCFGAERTVNDDVVHHAAILQSRWVSLHVQRFWMGAGAAAVFGGSIGMFLWLSHDAVLSGEMSAGGLAMAVACLVQALRPMEALAASARDATQALAWIRPLSDLRRADSESSTAGTERPAASRCQAGTVLPAVMPPRISFHGVIFGYGSGQRVLDGLDLDVPAGRTVAIVGESGSGKSSLFKLLLRLYDAQSGQILIDGSPLVDCPPAPMRRTIAVIPQDTVMLHDTIAANIAIGDPNVPRQAIEYAARIAQIHAFVCSLPAGYDTLVGERGVTLSGGERQRIAIARAALRHPRIILLDEATSMLDAETEAAVLRGVREIRSGCTTLMIAHRLSSVVDADRIAVMHRGRIVEQGTHSQLLTADGTYARMWRVQSGQRNH